MAGKLPTMDPLLREIFLAAYQFLQARQTALDDEDYWQRAADDMLIMSDKYHHPLMDVLLVAVYEYLSGEVMKKRGDDREGFSDGRIDQTGA